MQLDSNQNASGKLGAVHEYYLASQVNMFDELDTYILTGRLMLCPFFLT